MDKKQAAQNVYKQLRNYLDEQDIKYDRNDEEMNIWFAMRGDDMRVPLDIRIDEKYQMVKVLSPLEFKIPQEFREDMARVINQLNFMIINGCIDYDFETGSVAYRINATFEDSIIGNGTLHYLIGTAINTVEAFNVKFFLIVNGKMSAQAYLKKLTSDNK